MHPSTPTKLDTSVSLFSLERSADGQEATAVLIRNIRDIGGAIIQSGGSVLLSANTYMFMILIQRPTRYTLECYEANSGDLIGEICLPAKPRDRIIRVMCESRQAVVYKNVEGPNVMEIVRWW